MSICRFFRLTNAFSKKSENQTAAVALHFMHYNFCRVHQTLSITPAMEAGISSHVWSPCGTCRAAGRSPPKSGVDELASVIGLNRTMLWKYENGKLTPTAEALETLADRLDATMDYFHERGPKYVSPERAAIEMSFDVFQRRTDSDIHRERCRRIVPDDRAPRTADAWKTLAELMDKALPVTPPQGLGVVRGGKQ
jgi:transcriptional regulator with XRE-family HTH domain